MGQKCEEGGRDEYLMDCQYEYDFVNPPDHHGFLPHHASQRIDPLVEKRIICLQREKWNSGMME